MLSWLDWTKIPGLPLGPSRSENQYEGYANAKYIHPNNVLSAEETNYRMGLWTCCSHCRMDKCHMSLSIATATTQPNAPHPICPSSPCPPVRVCVTVTVLHARSCLGPMGTSSGVLSKSMMIVQSQNPIPRAALACFLWHQALGKCSQAGSVFWAGHGSEKHWGEQGRKGGRASPGTWLS